VKLFSFLTLACAVALTAGAQNSSSLSNSAVRFRVTFGANLAGDLDIELFGDKPVTVSNFLAYVQSGKYDRSILHRCDPGFVLQGGGWTVPNPRHEFPFVQVSRISQFPAITNELAVGTPYNNTNFTIAMARDGTNLNSARSEWFFNLANNSPHLDTNDGGSVVFGRVTNAAGQNLLRQFNQLPTNNIINMTSVTFRANCSAVEVSPGGQFAYPFTELPTAAPQFLCPSYTHLYAVRAIMLSGPDVLPPKLEVKSPRRFATDTNEIITFRGTASDNSGVASVRVTVGDLSIVTSNASPTWTLMLTNPPPGTNFALVEATDTAGLTTTITHPFFRSVRVPFDLMIVGATGGKVSGPADEDMLEVGRGYKLAAKPTRGHLFGGWSGSSESRSATLRFIMRSNFSVTATFVTNLFPYVKGTYNGLFHDGTNVEQASSGFFTLTVGHVGGYSGKLLLNGQRHSFKGTFWVDGTGSNQIPRRGTNALRVLMTLDLTNGTDQITGFVSEETPSNTVWSVELMADRAVFGGTNSAPLAGKYTLIVPADTNHANGPFGDGYGAVSVSAKAGVGFNGALADGTKVAQKTSLSKMGHWPLYIPLYKGKGALVSWVGFDTNQPDTDFSGLLNWFKQSQPAAKYFPLGFTNESTIAGSRFTKPAPTNWVLNLTSAVAGFTNGNLAANFTNHIAIDAKGKVLDLGTNKLRLSASKSSGLFSGSVTPHGATKAVSFKGAVLQKQTNGSGFFLGSNQSGRVTIRGE
jgi:cyclophilin family peptidyl-prolyl cis-trans isomerase